MHLGNHRRSGPEGCDDAVFSPPPPSSGCFLLWRQRLKPSLPPQLLQHPLSGFFSAPLGEVRGVWAGCTHTPWCVLRDMVGPLTVPTCFQAGRGRLNSSLHGPDVIYVNHKRRRGDLACAQHSPCTSPGSGARIYKQCHIHGSVTCSIHSASAGRPPHKWNIIPCCVHCVFPSAVCFLSCSALADGEVVSCSPQAGAGAGGCFCCHFQGSTVTPAGKGVLPALGNEAPGCSWARWSVLPKPSLLRCFKMFLIQPPKSSFWLMD